MQKNMGSADRIIRIIMAAIIALLFFTNAITGVLGIILLYLSIIFVITSFIGSCPVYVLFGGNTRRKGD